MNAKYFALAAVVITAFSVGYLVMEDSEDSEAAAYALNFQSYNSSQGAASAARYMGDVYAYITSGTSVESGTAIRLEAFPSSGYYFYRWTVNGNTVSYNSTYYTTMPSNSVTYVAHFAASTPETRYQVSVESSNTTYGEASVAYYRDDIGDWYWFTSPGNLDVGDQVRAYAVPHSGYRFVNWTVDGTVVSTSSDYQFTMPSRNYSLVANFQSTTPSTYTITVGSNNSDFGTTTGAWLNSGTWVWFQSSSNRYAGDTVRGYAVANTGYHFVSWTENGTVVSTSADYQFTMPSRNYNIVANFEADPTYAVNFSPNDSDYGYTSAAYDLGGTWVWFPSGASRSPGDLIRLYAVPKDGYRFLNWSSNGTVVSTSADYQFTMPSNAVTYTANFEILTFEVTIVSNNTDYGTVSRGSISSVPYGSEISVNGSSLIINRTTVTATPTTSTAADIYLFGGWNVNDGDTVTEAMTITATFTHNVPQYAVNFSPNDSDYGYASAAYSQGGTWVWFISGASRSVGESIKLHAVPKDGYRFVSWTDSNDVVVSTESNYYFTMPSNAVTYTANFEPAPSSANWTNGHYNGRIDLVYRFSNTDNMTHTMIMDLYSADIGDDGIAVWEPMDYQLQIEISYPTLIIKSTLLYQGTPVGVTETATLGNWPTFLISIDSEAGTVTVTPVRTFDSFQSYTLYDKQTTTVFEFLKDTAVRVITHNETGNETNRARFSIVRTDVFLNTYGAVMNNPSINVYEYFPQYEKVRLNFYSFALYGTSMTVNGTTYVLDGAYIYIDYVTDPSGGHHLPSYDPEAQIKTKKVELTNIYVTWDGSHVSMTFVNDRFTIDLGEYTPHAEIISFQGLWYFSSMIYEPTTEKEKALGGWKVLPEVDKNTMLLIFLGFLLLIGAFAYIHVRRSNGGYVDLIIIGCAALVALVMLGA